MGYWVAVQVNTMRRSVIYKSNLRMWYMILRRVHMVSCEILLRSHLRSTSRISLIFSGRGRSDGRGDEL